ncbi:unnamed protein product [Ectocarpus sp. CCAP 1310/34]|nr:unnamed protein product [Ectocarpus sp. CCAP 1310/34]
MSRGPSVVISSSSPSNYHGSDEHDEEDPLGLLRGTSADIHDGVEMLAGSSSLLRSHTPLREAVGCESGDPREVIDAMLRSSKTIRDQVSSRQARTLNSYKAENKLLYRELSLLPPTYSQYRAVRERVSARRREQNVLKTAGPTASTPICHPLNFHLNGTEAQVFNEDDCPQPEGFGPTMEAPELGNTRALEDEKKRGGDKGTMKGNTGPGPRCGEGGDNTTSHGRPSLEGGGSASMDEEPANEQPSSGWGRRCSTSARAGSASETPTARKTAPPPLQRVETRRGEDVPAALWRSKVRRRQMVFSLLEAARIEEENMLDALMAEYDPRPSRNLPQPTLDRRLRMALSWPEITDEVVAGGNRDAASCRHAVLDQRKTVDQGGRGGGGGGEREHADADIDNGCNGAECAGGNRNQYHGEGEGEKAWSLSRSGRAGGRAAVDCGATGGDEGEGGGEIGGSDQVDDDARGGEARGEAVAGAGSGASATAVAGRGTEEFHPEPSPCRTSASPTCGADASDDDIEDTAVAISASPTKRAATEDGGPARGGVEGGDQTKRLETGQRKDLPGLVGGDKRGLSRLVSDTVSYINPAFPNLEFYRRAAMDRAGYFMPGYKPQGISPGPAAGAYWLERRQSYRVKMSAPPSPGRGSTSTSNAGRRKTSQQRPRRRSPRHDNSQHRPNVTALTLTPSADNDRSRPSAGLRVKHDGKTAGTTARPISATRAATAPAAPRRGPPQGIKEGESSREERGK